MVKLRHIMLNNSVWCGKLKGVRNTLKLLWITQFNWWLYHKLYYLSQRRIYDEEFCQKPTERCTCTQRHILQVSDKFTKLKDVAKEWVSKDPPGILLHGSRSIRQSKQSGLHIPFLFRAYLPSMGTDFTVQMFSASVEGL